MYILANANILVKRNSLLFRLFFGKIKVNVVNYFF